MNCLVLEFTIFIFFRPLLIVGKKPQKNETTNKGECYHIYADICIYIDTSKKILKKPPATSEADPIKSKLKQMLNIYNLFNKLMSFKIQCQNIMQLNMLVMFVMKHLCSC